MSFILKGPIVTIIFFVVVGCISLVKTTEVPTQPDNQPRRQKTYHPVYWIDAGDTDDL